MSKKTKKQLNTEIKRLNRQLVSKAAEVKGTSKGKLKQIIRGKNEEIKTLCAQVTKTNEEKQILFADNRAMSKTIKEWHA